MIFVTYFNFVSMFSFARLMPLSYRSIRETAHFSMSNLFSIHFPSIHFYCWREYSIWNNTQLDDYLHGLTRWRNGITREKCLKRMDGIARAFKDSVESGWMSFRNDWMEREKVNVQPVQIRRLKGRAVTLREPRERKLKSTWRVIYNR